MDNASLFQAVRTIHGNRIQNKKVYNSSIKRDPGIWIFGSWMGNRFADNSRFLFQYISENKNLYGINKAVWVTKSNDVAELVRNMGYEACVQNEPGCEELHLRAGYHIICNSIYKDIDSSLSAGAVKIQLWHGVGIKACGRLNRQKNTIKQKLADKFIWPYYDPGEWRDAYFLATSPENARVAIEDYGYQKKQIIIDVYPRLCKCPQYTPDEISIINSLKRQKANGMKVVLYLPTFRDDQGRYLEPFSIYGFDEFLNDNSVLWIQKKHSAAKQFYYSVHSDNVMELNSDVDINVLYDYVDLLVTDYSSASSDAVFKGVRTLEYCPDISAYNSHNRRFVAEFSSYHAEEPVTDPGCLISVIRKRLFEPMDEKTMCDYSEVRRFLFGDSTEDMDSLVKKIIEKNPRPKEGDNL